MSPYMGTEFCGHMTSHSQNVNHRILLRVCIAMVPYRYGSLLHFGIPEQTLDRIITHLHIDRDTHTFCQEAKMRFFRKKTPSKSEQIQQQMLALISAEEQIQTLQNLLQNERKERAVAEMALCEANTRVKSLQETLDAKNQSISGLTATLEVSRGEVSSLQDKNEALKLTLKKTNQDNRELQRKNESSEVFCLQLKQELHKERQSGLTLRQEVSGLRQEKKAVQHVLSQTQTEVQTLKSELCDSQRNFESQQKEKTAVIEALKKSVEAERIKFSEEQDLKTKAAEAMVKTVEEEKHALEKALQRSTKEAQVSAQRNANEREKNTALQRTLREKDITITDLQRALHSMKTTSEEVTKNAEDKLEAITVANDNNNETWKDKSPNSQRS